MILGNTYVILVYRHFNAYSIGNWNMIYGQMPIEYVLKYLYAKITQVFLESYLIHTYRYFTGQIWINR